MELPSPTTLASVAAGATAGVTAVITLAKPAAIGAAKLLETLLGKPVEVAGGMLADTVYGWQVTNRINVAVKVKEKLDAAGIEPKAVAPDFLLPYLEAVGNVSDETLQDLWAELLSSVVKDKTKAHPLHVDTLKRLSPNEAKVFHAWILNGPSQHTPSHWGESPQGNYVVAGRLVALGLLQIVPSTFGSLSRRFEITDYGYELASAVGVHWKGKPTLG